MSSIGSSKASDDARDTGLIRACWDKDLPTVENWLKDPNTDVNAKNGLGETALMIACQVGRLDIVQALLQHKDIGVNAQSDLKRTPLMYACRWGKLAIVKELLKNLQVVEGIRELKEDTLGDTVLDMARKRGYKDILAALLDSLGLIGALLDATALPESIRQTITDYVIKAGKYIVPKKTHKTKG